MKNSQLLGKLLTDTVAKVRYVPVLKTNNNNPVELPGPFLSDL